eukprot:6783755-Prymnesium_polylepis.1
MRRNAMVGVQKGAEAVGYDTAMHAKKVSQHRGDGQACREKVYDRGFNGGDDGHWRILDGAD